MQGLGIILTGSKQIGSEDPLVSPKFIYNDICAVSTMCQTLCEVFPGLFCLLIRAAPELGIANPDKAIEAKEGKVEEMREKHV